MGDGGPEVVREKRESWTESVSISDIDSSLEEYDEEEELRLSSPSSATGGAGKYGCGVCLWTSGIELRGLPFPDRALAALSAKVCFTSVATMEENFSRYFALRCTADCTRLLRR